MLLVVDGLKVKTIRRALGISQRECCKMAGISRRALQRMEMGCNCRPATVRRIAAVLGVDAESLASPKHRCLGRLMRPSTVEEWPETTAARELVRLGLL